MTFRSTGLFPLLFLKVNKRACAFRESRWPFRLLRVTTDQRPLHLHNFCQYVLNVKKSNFSNFVFHHKPTKWTQRKLKLIHLKNKTRQNRYSRETIVCARTYTSFHAVVLTRPIALFVFSAAIWEFEVVKYTNINNNNYYTII